MRLAYKNEWQKEHKLSVYNLIVDLRLYIRKIEHGAGTKVTEGDLRGIEEVGGGRRGGSVGRGLMSAPPPCRRGEEDRRRVQILAHAVADHSPELLSLLLPHFSANCV